MSELESLLDELESLEFWSVEFWKRETSKYWDQPNGYTIQWGHNRISWVDLPQVFAETREDALRILIRLSRPLLATDHQFGASMKKTS